MNPADAHRLALARIRQEKRPARAWVTGSKIPWHDPAFSRRMLDVHLDPSTHMASRSGDVIARHLDWLIAQVAPVSGGPGHILDVGCGPGLYCHDLARRGWRATGFDFAPAPLNWARSVSQAENLDCRFLEEDLTRLPSDFADQVGPVDAVTFWFGEFNSFPPEAARDFLPRLTACLRPGGLLILEYQPWDLFVREDSSEWSLQDKSVFCDEPHIWLQEYHWDEAARAEIHLHWILEFASGRLGRYVQCHQGWTDEELVEILATAGLEDPVFHPPVTGIDERFEFPLVVTRKATGGG
jgi:SAM-dependent methyltransferase